MDLDPNAVLIWFIQVVGLTAAVIFGVFSALSWSQAVKAGYEAAAANTIAMVTLCSSQVRTYDPDLLSLRRRDMIVFWFDTETDPLGALCMSITGAAQQSLSAVASSLFPSQATSSTAPTATASGSPSGSDEPSKSVITAATVVSVTLVALGFINTFLRICALGKRRFEEFAHFLSSPSGPRGY